MRVTISSTSGKVLASVALVAVAAGVASLGTFGSFTSTTSASQVVSSGTVTIALGTAGAVNDRLSLGASGLVPGDTVSRTVTLANTGNQPLAAITLSTLASPSSKLDTDVTTGLRAKVDLCSVAWTEAGTSPKYTYTCSGSTTAVLTDRAVIGSDLALAGLTATVPGKTDFLRVTMTLPTTADNALQGLSSTVNFAFTGTQRTSAAQ